MVLPAQLGLFAAPLPESRVAAGDRLGFLRALPDGAARLVVTSPPYNVGKEYEDALTVEDYVAAQEATLREAVRVLAADGSLCWQVGNFVAPRRKAAGRPQTMSIVPIDCLLWPVFEGLGLRLRNRIVWTFGHGEHCKLRLSPRYETILWFTKSDDYVFDLDPIRVPQKYPGKKAFRGPRAGQYVCHPLGKNPGDVWEVPNVKSAHPEKTEHPCQFPVELVERLVLALTRAGDLVVDPYCGAGSSLVAALKHGRRAAGCDLEPRYVAIAESRIAALRAGTLPLRPMGRPLLDPRDAGAVGRPPPRA
jgi:adenine-specific DNA-methyltransferase